MFKFALAALLASQALASLTFTIVDGMCIKETKTLSFQAQKLTFVFSSL